MTIKLAHLAAAASLAFAGGAFAQTTPPSQDLSAPMGSTPSESAPAPQADPAAAAPPATTAPGDFKVGAPVKDPTGVVVGSIAETSAAADGSTNVVVSNGAAKFALPAASLSPTADGFATTATKAQIDATLASAGPR